MSVEGTWNIFIDSPMGRQSAVLELRADGDGLSGTQSNDGESETLHAVTLRGDDLSWSVSIKKPIPLDLEFCGKVDHNSITGSVSTGAFGTFPFDGEKALLF